MTARRKLVHTEILRIRWGDMDALEHVNNTVYFRYMDYAKGKSAPLPEKLRNVVER